MMQVEYIKGYNITVPSWQSCFDNFNISINKGTRIKNDGFGFFVSHDAESIHEVACVMSDLETTVAHLYISLITGDQGFGKHNDTDDVYFWQVQGKTAWIVCDQKYILEPGDLIKVPALTYHHVISLTPRIGISMSKQ